jgi:hypothetical protein
MMARTLGNPAFMAFWVVLALGAFFQAPTAGYAFEIDVQVSPYQVNLGSQGEDHTVRVWTNFRYALTAEITVSINGQEIDAWKTSDSRGYLVAKFYVNELQELADAGHLEIFTDNLLRIDGTTKDGVLFWGEGDIFIIEQQGN